MSQGKIHNGLSRSASLLRALGPGAAPVWAELDPQDAAAIAKAMDEETTLEGEADAAASAFLEDATRTLQSSASIWARLSALPIPHLADLLNDESPQVIALTLSRLEPQAAAALVRRFPALLATDILHRMLHIASPHKAALSAIEANFENRISQVSAANRTRPDETLARLFDHMSPEDSVNLLSALQEVEPGASERIRALMFTFADLAGLSPAGLQTLLSRADRATLTLALKGVSGDVATAFLSNMTTRAREILHEEIAALGPQRRTDVEMARARLVSLTRALIESGDIQPGGAEFDEELIA